MSSTSSLPHEFLFQCQSSLSTLLLRSLPMVFFKSSLLLLSVAAFLSFCLYPLPTSSSLGFRCLPLCLCLPASSCSLTVTVSVSTACLPGCLAAWLPGCLAACLAVGRLCFMKMGAMGLYSWLRISLLGEGGLKRRGTQLQDTIVQDTRGVLQV